MIPEVNIISGKARVANVKGAEGLEGALCHSVHVSSGRTPKENF